MTQRMANKRTSQDVATEVTSARTMYQRMRGLMGAKELSPGSALWFPRCNWIHTLFVRFPLDIIYLDKNLKVVDIQHSLKPWRLPAPRWRAYSVLEMRGGSLASQDLQIGDELVCG